MNTFFQRHWLKLTVLAVLLALLSLPYGGQKFIALLLIGGSGGAIIVIHLTQLRSPSTRAKHVVALAVAVLAYLVLIGGIAAGYELDENWWAYLGATVIFALALNILHRHYKTIRK